jgi:hypothetical protein
MSKVSRSTLTQRRKTTKHTTTSNNDNKKIDDSRITTPTPMGKVQEERSKRRSWNSGMARIRWIWPTKV